MYAQSNSELETNNSTTNVQILFPNGGLPTEAFLNNYQRRGSFQDSVYGSFPPTPNNRDEAGSKAAHVPQSLFFPTPAKQNDNQLFLSPTQGGWQNSTTFSMNGQTQNEQAYPTTESAADASKSQSMAPVPYVSSWALADSPTQTPSNRSQGQSNGVSTPLVISLNNMSLEKTRRDANKGQSQMQNIGNDRRFFFQNLHAPISSHLFEEFGLHLCEESVNNLQSFGVHKLSDLSYADLYRVALRPEEKEMLDTIKDRFISSTEYSAQPMANNFVNYSEKRKEERPSYPSFNMPSLTTQQSQATTNKADAPSGEEQPELSMAELHEIGQCRPCAYHCHKEDGCRRGADCTFCHMCGPEMLRTRRKEKAKRIKSEMKLRKQEEKEKTKKNNEREAYLNFNTPTNSTKLSSYAHGVDSTMLTSTYASGVDSHMLASPFHFQDRTSEMSNPLLRRPYVSGLNSQTVSMAQGFDPVLH
jgi:hypothetical protein